MTTNISKIIYFGTRTTYCSPSIIFLFHIGLKSDVEIFFTTNPEPYWTLYFSSPAPFWVTATTLTLCQALLYKCWTWLSGDTHTHIIESFTRMCKSFYYFANKSSRFCEFASRNMNIVAVIYYIYIYYRIYIINK